MRRSPTQTKVSSKSLKLYECTSEISLSRVTIGVDLTGILGDAWRDLL